MPTTHDAAAAFTVARRLLSAEDCERVLALARGAERGGVIEGAADAGTRRRSAVAWLQSSPESAWVLRRLEALRAATPFDVDIDGVEPLQVATYGPGDGYGWHIDLGPGPASRRKLSVSVLLSDRCDFVGGELELGADRGVSAGLQRGDAVVFPSYLRHRVRPVESGERRSLVAWFTGPPWR